MFQMMRYEKILVLYLGKSSLSVAVQHSVGLNFLEDLSPGFPDTGNCPPILFS